MTNLFLGFLNRSLSAAVLIFAVVLVRLAFKKAPKWLLCALWALAAVRLLCPFSIESVLSLIPSAEPVQPEIVYSAAPAITSGIPAVDAIVNPPLQAAFTPDPAQSANPLQILTELAAWVWLGGCAVLILYAAISALRLRLRVRTAVRLEGNVFQSEFVPSPFILGVLRPRIYLPFGLEPGAQDMVLAHERAHLKRGDQLWKPLGFLLLTAYWFNPVCWLAYVLFCRDIEAACDEKVVRELGESCKTAYSRALLQCSVPRRMITACPLAFGETGREGPHQVRFKLQKACVLGRAGGGIRVHRRGRVLPDRPEDRRRAAGGRAARFFYRRQPRRGRQHAPDKRVLFQYRGLRRILYRSGHFAGANRIQGADRRRI